MVADPEALQASKRDLPTIAFDQTPVWLKLRAEDKLMLSIEGIHQATLRRALARAVRQVEPARLVSRRS